LYTFIIIFYYKKVRLAKTGNNFMAVKFINKKESMETYYGGGQNYCGSRLKFYHKKYLNLIETEREVGLFGYECKFICKLLNTFQDQVILITLFFMKYITIILKFTLLKYDFLYFMELLNGGDLDWHLYKRKMFKEYEAKFYTAQIICGLFYLHSKEIIHGYIIIVFIM